MDALRAANDRVNMVDHASVLRAASRDRAGVGRVASHPAAGTAGGSVAGVGEVHVARITSRPAPSAIFFVTTSIPLASTSSLPSAIPLGRGQDRHGRGDADAVVLAAVVLEDLHAGQLILYSPGKVKGLTLPFVAAVVEPTISPNLYASTMPMTDSTPRSRPIGEEGDLAVEARRWARALPQATTPPLAVGAADDGHVPASMRRGLVDQVLHEFIAGLAGIAAEIEDDALGRRESGQRSSGSSLLALV